MDMQDADLLRAYVSGSETAFAELVNRHVDFVYSTAYRQLGDRDLAEETAQAVFNLLARKASRLTNLTALAGWLYRATVFTSAKALRTELRRRRREREAVEMIDHQGESEEVWKNLAPLLDEGLKQLGEKDRLAILLRFFQRKPMREVAETLEISEAAAKMRIARALEKLRLFYSKEGLACSATALAAVLTENAVQAAPLLLARNIASTVSCGTAASGLATFAIIEELIFMAKVKTGTAAATAAAILLIPGGFIWYRSSSPAPAENAGIKSRSPAGQEAKAEGGTTQGARAVLDRLKAAAVPVNQKDGLERAKASLRAALHAPMKSGVRSYPPEDVVNAALLFGNNSQALFEILKEGSSDSDQEVRMRAISAIGRMKANPETGALLWNILRGSNKELSGLALSGLMNPSNLKGQDLPALAEILTGTQNPQLKRYIPEAIAATIQRDAPVAPADVAVVRNLLNHPDETVRFEAACALAQSEGAGNPKILEILGAGLKIESGIPGIGSLQQFMALETLQRLGQTGKPLAGEVESFLKSSKDPGMRESASLTLAMLDPQFRKNMPEVDQAMREEENRKAWNQKWMSGNYTFEDLLTALKEPMQAGIAAKHLGEMNVNAADTVPQLMAALAGQDEGTKEAIARAIQKIAPGTEIPRVDGQTLIRGAMEAIITVEGRPADVKNKAVLRELEPYHMGISWYTRDEIEQFSKRLAQLDPEAHRIFAGKAIEADPSLAKLFQVGK